MAADVVSQSVISQPSRNAERRYAFVFVCQQGELELKALLLAASLRRFLRCSYQLIAALPTPVDEWGTPSDQTLSALQDMGVDLVRIVNPAGRDYGFANKIACAEIPVEADKLVFLDSDMLCIRNFADESRFGIEVNVKPADHMTYSVDERVWRSVYDVVGVSPPSVRLPASASQEFSFPYFNAGFVSVDPRVHLGRTWKECFLQLCASPEIANINSPAPQKAFWIDQVSLAVAITKLELSYDCLDERFNYPANLKPLDNRHLPYFCHYHFSHVVEQEQVLSRIAHSLADESAAIRAVASTMPMWRFLLEPKHKLGPHISSRQPRPLARIFRRRKTAECQSSGPNIIITGIPRSGTSYLCNLLHRYSNCVVVNEPAELLVTLANELLPWSVPRLYRKLRSDIAAGRPISNKLHDGSVTYDTLISGEASEYVPRVDGNDFVLATKNTIAYLTRLESIRRVMPDVRVIACVRNPFDTIASWKTSFPHLRDVDISGLPVGNEREPWLSGTQRQSLQRIMDTADLAQRRGLRWHYFATRVLDQGHTVSVVRYNELVTDPERVLTTILEGFPKGQLREPMQASAIRSGADALDAVDRQAIRAICPEPAAALGLW